MNPRVFRFLTASMVAGYAWLALHAGNFSVPTPCLFKLATGLPCPACGTTRSVILLLAGHPKEAFFMNPLGIFFAPALAITPLWLVYDWLRKSATLSIFVARLERNILINRWVAVSCATILLLNWGWNIAKGL